MYQNYSYSSPSGSFPKANNYSSTSFVSSSTAVPEWQEYRLSPTVSFKGDRVDFRPLNPSFGDSSQLRKSHELRTLSVQDALGIARDVPDEWVESIKELIGRHLRAQIKL